MAIRFKHSGDVMWRDEKVGRLERIPLERNRTKYTFHGEHKDAPRILTTVDGQRALEAMLRKHFLSIERAR